MSVTATQTARPLAVSTVLKKDPATGKDKLVARRFQADEAISRLFHASVDVIADRNVEFTFDQLLGTPVLVELPTPQTKGTRYFHGVCRRVTQTGGDADRSHFRLDLVPQAWLLTKRTQSRIFQQLTVPDILKKLLVGFTTAPAFELGKYEPRNYCVQYHETHWYISAR